MDYAKFDLELDRQLSEIDILMESLHNLRKRILKEKERVEVASYGPMNMLLEIVRANPGCTKKEIRTAMSENLTERELNILLTKARRNWEFIENKGTRHQPKWYISISGMN